MCAVVSLHTVCCIYRGSMSVVQELLVMVHEVVEEKAIKGLTPDTTAANTTTQGLQLKRGEGIRSSSGYMCLATFHILSSLITVNLSLSLSLSLPLSLSSLPLPPVYVKMFSFVALGKWKTYTFSSSRTQSHVASPTHM